MHPDHVAAAVLVYTRSFVTYSGTHKGSIVGVNDRVRIRSHPGPRGRDTLYSLLVVGEAAIDAIAEETDPVHQFRTDVKLDGTSMTPGYLHTQAVEQVDADAVVHAYREARHH